MANKKNNKRSSGGLNPNYLTKMGAHNLIANRSMSFSSISVLTACLLLIGISVVILLNIQNLVKDVEKQNVVVAFVKLDADDETTAKVGTDLLAIPNVEAVEFVSKDEALENQSEDFPTPDTKNEDILQIVKAISIKNKLKRIEYIINVIYMNL